MIVQARGFGVAEIPILEVEWVYFSIEEEKKVKGVCT